MTTLDDFIASATPRTLTVPVCSRGDLVEELDTLTQRLNALRGDSLAGPGSEGVEISQRIQAIEDEMEAFTIQVTVRSLGNRAWADLKAKHLPTKQEREVGLDVHMATFPVAAVAACAVEPAMNIAQARLLDERLVTGEWVKLWSAVVGVNMGVLETPKSVVATAVLQANGNSSTSPEPGPSPDPGSLGGSDEQSPPTSTGTEAG